MSVYYNRYDSAVGHGPFDPNDDAIPDDGPPEPPSNPGHRGRKYKPKDFDPRKFKPRKYNPRKFKPKRVAKKTWKAAKRYGRKAERSMKRDVTKESKKAEKEARKAAKKAALKELKHLEKYAGKLFGAALAGVIGAYIKALIEGEEINYSGVLKKFKLFKKIARLAGKLLTRLRGLEEETTDAISALAREAGDLEEEFEDALEDLPDMVVEEGEEFFDSMETLEAALEAGDAAEAALALAAALEDIAVAGAIIAA